MEFNGCEHLSALQPLNLAWIRMVADLKMFVLVPFPPVKMLTHCLYQDCSTYLVCF
jgi:hypothetical protein